MTLWCRSALKVVRDCRGEVLVSEGRDRQPDARWETTGPPSDAAGWRSAHLMSALTRLWTVIFRVSYIHCRGRLKRPFFPLPGRLSGVTMVISSRRHNICSLCPLPLWYATVLCPATTATVHLVCGPRQPSSNKWSTDRLIASAERPVTIIPLTIGLSVIGNR